MDRIKNILKLNFLFLILVLVQFFLYFYLLASHRIPGGFDGFQYFHLQYYFLNNAVVSKEIPLWIPYMTHGTVATWWYSIQAGLLQNVLLFLSPIIGFALKNVNFVLLYHLGMFVDEILLLTGSWLLARKLFSSTLTCFFVCGTVLGTSVWMIQPWYNFHFYYALPFLLFFIHQSFESGKWRYFFLGVSLLTLQTLGNLPYLIPVTGFVLFSYALFFLLLNFKEIFPRFKKTFSFWKASAACVTTVLLVAGAFAIVMINTDQIVNYNYERLLSGETTLEGFLTYGRNVSAKKWLELLWGVPTILDITLYLGMLPLVFLILGFLFGIRRQSAHVFLLALTLFLLSNGTFLSQLLYHLWPGMKYYRHLSLIAPIIKLFLCFAAGYGFEFFLNKISSPDKPNIKHLKNALTLLACLLLGLSIFLFALAREWPLAEKVVASVIEKSTYKVDEEKKMRIFVSGLTEFYDPQTLPQQMRRAATIALFTSLVLLILVHVSRQKIISLLIFLALLIHVADLFYYKLFQLTEKSISLKGPLAAITRFQNLPFHKKRELDFGFKTPRENILYHLKFHPHYWSTYAFLFKDQIGHNLRTDHWLRPLNDYMKTYWGQPLTDKSVPPKGLSTFNFLVFPLGHPASAKIAGATEEKIQFFKHALCGSNEQLVSKLMQDKEYRGDILFLSPCPEEKNLPVARWQQRDSLSQNTRLALAYRVERFDSNNLMLVVDNPEHERVWFFYSDVWHPLWKVTINNSSVPIYKANLAYKAIALERGMNKIHLFCQSPILSAFYFFWGLMALGWIGVLGYWTFRLMVEE